jgi:hypothetical protein
MMPVLRGVRLVTLMCIFLTGAISRRWAAVGAWQRLLVFRLVSFKRFSF